MEFGQLIEERVYWLAWSQITGVGPVLLQRLQEKFGNLAAAWKASAAELRTVEGFGYQTLTKVLEQRSQLHPQQLFVDHQKTNPHFWTPADPDYPQLLREIPSPPPILYYRGEVDLTENHGQKTLIGIVGTRQPTDYGIRWTHQITKTLVKNGFTIVSGMAAGIDRETHLATIKAGGRTIGVLGTGVDIIYPAKNRDLYQQILTSGLVISEYAAKTPPNRTHFPRRNRIIAGLSRAVLVMEAPSKSGALITANYANEFGRDVYALPGRLDDQPSQGCLTLISQGAGLIHRELNELLKMLGAIPQIDAEIPIIPSTPTPKLSPELQQVMDTLLVDTLTFDFIVQKTGIAAGLVSSSLLQLELLGLISQLPGMRYRKIS
jgi:DNA processing protein